MPFKSLTTSSNLKPESKKPSSSTVYDLTLIVSFAALIIVLAFVSVPVGTAGVPIVLQNAAVILTGLILGPRRGFLSVLLFLTLGLIGLPVLANGKTTLAALAGPTVGYIVGYLVSVVVVGLIAYHAPRKNSGGFTAFLALAAFAGLMCQYLCGTVGLVFKTGMTFTAAFISQGPFIIPDCAKTIAVVLIAAGVHKAFPDVWQSTKSS